MISSLKLTLLVDNSPSSSELKVEHGLSIWIEADNYRILFDTGQSDLLFYNTEKLNIDLSTANSVILSHGHYDHTGGVARVLNVTSKANIYCHSSVLVTLYSRQPDGYMKPIGIDSGSSKALHESFNKIQWVNEPFYISEDIGITGTIPRITDFENTGGDFYLDSDGKNIDQVSDDLAVWFKTSKGLCIVTGCCHSGLINTIKYIFTLTREITLHSVIGGFHLLHASTERMENTCRFLASTDFKQLVPCHCTGENAIEILRTKFGDNLICGSVGKQMVIN